MLKSALDYAKGNEDEKVGLSVQLPKRLKEEFEILCKANSVSMASVMQGLIHVAIKENKEGSLCKKNYSEIVSLNIDKDNLAELIKPYVSIYSRSKYEMTENSEYSYKELESMVQEIFKIEDKIHFIEESL